MVLISGGFIKRPAMVGNSQDKRPTICTELKDAYSLHVSRSKELIPLLCTIKK